MFVKIFLFLIVVLIVLLIGSKLIGIIIGNSKNGKFQNKEELFNETIPGIFSISIVALAVILILQQIGKYMFFN